MIWMWTRVRTWYTLFIHVNLHSPKTCLQLMSEERSSIRTVTSPCRATSGTTLMKWRNALRNTSLESWGRLFSSCPIDTTRAATSDFYLYYYICKTYMFDPENSMFCHFAIKKYFNDWWIIKIVIFLLIHLPLQLYKH